MGVDRQVWNSASYSTGTCHMARLGDTVSDTKTSGYIEFIIPLTNSRGFGKFLRFDYLVSDIWQMPLVVSPHILGMGDPYYTRQGLYFLSDIECAIRLMMLESNSTTSLQTQSQLAKFQKAADDCLFEYSLRNPSSRLTTRSDYSLPSYHREWIHKIVKDSYNQEYEFLLVDGGRALLLSPVAEELFEQIYTDYLNQIHVKTTGASEIKKEYDAWPQGLLSMTEEIPPVKFTEVPYTFEELALLSEVIPVDTEIFLPTPETSPTKRNDQHIAREWLISMFKQPYMPQVQAILQAKKLEQEVITVSRTYNPVLLDFYFAGLRSLSPIIEFRSYYSVIEYFFENAALESIKQNFDELVEKLKATDDFGEYVKLAKELKPEEAERIQIRQVIERYIDIDRIRSFLKHDLPKEAKTHFESFNRPVSGKEVQRLKQDNPDLQNLVADRIYSFRNAIFHAKRTWKGREANGIRPFSKEESEVVRHEAMLLKMVAQEIIKQAAVEV